MSASTRWLDDAQQQAWQDLLTVVIGLPTLLDRQLEAEAGISNFEYSVLARLSMTTASTMRQSDLAAQCNSTQPRLSKALRRLEQQGWVKRRVDPDNARYTLATLTAAGRRKVVQSAPGHVEQVRRLVFEPLTPTQQRQLAVALSRVAGPVRELLEQH